MKRAQNILELIGATPIVRLQTVVASEGAQVWAKLESVNPGGSVKDRIALAMVEEAEASGRLQPGGTIVEPTSGNTGIGLAMVAAVKGYRLIVTMFDTASRERRLQMQAFGAEVVLTSAADGMRGAIDRAEELVAENSGYFMPQQFENPANPEIHRLTTAREILSQMPEGVDVFAAGVGTGGSISGVGATLRQELGDRVRIVAGEPAGSPVLTGGEPGISYIEGIGAGFVPDTLDRSVVDEIRTIEDDDAYDMTRRLAREEGILVGVSAGANVWLAGEIARDLSPEQRVVTILCDSGLRYLSTRVYE
ncbi:MAG: cysteine synthase A [Gemmatimonadetes bacterium]|nr:cysteine synthase A [Gemmatimonadota bacterium]MBT7860609.1 cysteine synthase A [Gemmatimonadota bacterium]